MSYIEQAQQICIDERIDRFVDLSLAGQIRVSYLVIRELWDDLFDEVFDAVFSPIASVYEDSSDSIMDDRTRLPRVGRLFEDALVDVAGYHLDEAGSSGEDWVADFWGAVRRGLHGADYYQFSLDFSDLD